MLFLKLLIIALQVLGYLGIKTKESFMIQLFPSPLAIPLILTPYSNQSLPAPNLILPTSPKRIAPEQFFSAPSASLCLCGIPFRNST